MKLHLTDIQVQFLSEDSITGGIRQPGYLCLLQKTGQQADNKQYQKDVKDDFCDSSHCTGNTAEAEGTGDVINYKNDDGIA